MRLTKTIVLTLVTVLAFCAIASAHQNTHTRRRSHTRSPGGGPPPTQLPPPITIGPPAAPVSVASPSQPEYLSGKVTVRVSGNDNPIIRVGLASSGVTLVEFPAMDRFFALHPGNSDLVTIDESPTKQNDHFFVFRAGSNFLPPPSRPSTAPSTSIIAQMRSGLVITLLVYPVRQVEDMAHTVVILYDRTDVVASRRADVSQLDGNSAHAGCILFIERTPTLLCG